MKKYWPTKEKLRSLREKGLYPDSFFVKFSLVYLTFYIYLRSFDLTFFKESFLSSKYDFTFALMFIKEMLIYPLLISFFILYLYIFFSSKFLFKALSFNVKNLFKGIHRKSFLDLFVYISGVLFFLIILSFFLKSSIQSILSLFNSINFLNDFSNTASVYFDMLALIIFIFAFLSYILNYYLFMHKNRMTEKEYFGEVSEKDGLVKRV